MSSHHKIVCIWRAAGLRTVSPQVLPNLHPCVLCGLAWQRADSCACCTALTVCCAGSASLGWALRCWAALSPSRCRCARCGVPASACLLPSSSGPSLEAGCSSPGGGGDPGLVFLTLRCAVLGSPAQHAQHSMPTSGVGGHVMRYLCLRSGPLRCNVCQRWRAFAAYPGQARQSEECAMHARLRLLACMQRGIQASARPLMRWRILFAEWQAPLF